MKKIIAATAALLTSHIAAAGRFTTLQLQYVYTFEE